MICDKCAERMSCTDTRFTADFSQRRRRYHCPKCGHRITTYEIEQRALTELASPNLDRVKQRIVEAVTKAIESTK